MLERAVLCLATAMVLSLLVRGVTEQANRTVGRLWPFSMARCEVAATPGCTDPAGVQRVASTGRFLR